MIGGTPTKTMPAALTLPQTSPVTSAQSIASGSGTPAFSAMPKITAASPAIAPTETSMPRVSTTNIWPMAISIRNEGRVDDVDERDRPEHGGVDRRHRQDHARPAAPAPATRGFSGSASCRADAAGGEGCGRDLLDALCPRRKRDEPATPHDQTRSLTSAISPTSEEMTTMPTPSAGRARGWCGRRPAWPERRCRGWARRG